MVGERLSSSWSRCLVCVLAAAAMGLMPVSAKATTSAGQLASGDTFSGSGTQQCSPDPDESFAIKVSITSFVATASGNTQGKFEGTATAAFEDGITSFSKFNGELEDGSIFNGQFENDEPGSGSFSGTLDADGTLSISFSGSEPGCPLFSGSFLAFESALGSLSSGEQATAVDMVRAGTAFYGQSIDARQSFILHKLLAGGPTTQVGGVMPLGDDALMFQYGSGQNAGEGMGYPWGVWGTFQYSDFSDDFAATAYDADRYAFIGGADFSPWDNFVAGLSVGYEDNDIDTNFNSGNQDISGVTLVPYLGALLPTFGLDFDASVDMSIGFGFLDVDQFRTAAGTRVTSSVDIDRVFWNGNFTASKQLGNLHAAGKVGFLVARDEYDAFTESDGSFVGENTVQLGQFRIGGDLAYLLGAWEPFVNATYEVDFDREELSTPVGTTQPANDNSDVVVGLGVRYYGERLSGALEYSTVLSREDFDAYSIMLLIRGDF